MSICAAYSVQPHLPSSRTNHDSVRRSWQPGPQIVGAGLRHWRIALRIFDTKPQCGQVASGEERSQFMRLSPSRTYLW